jgi:serine/threonine-protein kinase
MTLQQADPALADTIRSTVPGPDDLAKTVLSSSGSVSASRRTSLIASLAGVTGPLPDRYQEGKLLGKGGMGVVVQAEDRDLARPVAVKKLHAGGRNPDQVDRFLREAQLTAQLEHPGILPVHDLGVDQGGDFFYVMRLVQKEETLRSVIDRLQAGDEATHRELTFERRIEIVQQIARILQYAHSRGVIHRDVKPENIMLGGFGEVYLVDWGLAKATGVSKDPIAPPAAVGDATQTQAGTLLGTPRYMAPEQAQGKPATPLSDVYSLTAVLYELLSLHHYMGEDRGSLEDLLRKVLNDPPVFAAAHYDPRNGRVPPHLAVICMRGLEKNPAKRFASALELERALQQWLEGEGAVMCAVTLQLSLLNRYKRLLTRHPRIFQLVPIVMSLGALAGIGFALWRAFAH